MQEQKVAPPLALQPSSQNAVSQTVSTSAANSGGTLAARRLFWAAVLIDLNPGLRTAPRQGRNFGTEVVCTNSFAACS